MKLWVDEEDPSKVGFPSRCEVQRHQQFVPVALEGDILEPRTGQAGVGPLHPEHGLADVVNDAQRAEAASSSREPDRNCDVSLHQKDLPFLAYTQSVRPAREVVFKNVSSTLSSEGERGLFGTNEPGTDRDHRARWHGHAHL